MPTIEMRAISKRFGSTVACDSIDLDIRPGEVHALLGENGAGKTTLMNILYGFRRRDTGEIYIDGQSVALDSPHEAIQRRIGMVHQHFALIPTLTVADNYSLGREPMLRIYSPTRHVANAKRVADLYGLWVDPQRIVGELSIGLQQRVEIIRALSLGIEVLILDEPTAVLTQTETRELLTGLKAFVSTGKSVVFITHKLGEVHAVSDRVTVLRRGKLIATLDTSQSSQSGLAAMMTGSDLTNPSRTARTPGEVALTVSGVAVRDDRGRLAVSGVSFDVRQGEILGIAGVDGNGQSQLIEALAGLRPVEAGRIAMHGSTIPSLSPAKMIEAGVGHIPEDRHKWSLFIDLSVAENLLAERPSDPPFSSHGFLNRGAIISNAVKLIRRFSITPSNPMVKVRHLSGGNQQKTVVARALSREPKVVLANQPTRGLDVGAAEFIYRELLAQRGAGAAIVFVSADLDEVLTLSDRVAVMYEGRFAGIVDPLATTRDSIGLLMAAGTLDTELN